jgi:hypothetical protein
MLPMMMGDKKKITDGLVKSIMQDGKEEYSTDKKEFSETCKLAAMELMGAIEKKDVNAFINAFIALDSETADYAGEGETEIEIKI